MFPIPIPSQALVGLLPIPEDFRKLPDHFFIRLAVSLTSGYRELVPNLSSPRVWAALKAYTAERCQALSIIDLSVKLYENDEYLIRLLFQCSFMEDFRQELMELAEETGYGDIVTQQVATADPERLRAFFDIALEVGRQVIQEIDVVFDDWEQLEAKSKYYCEHVHHTLPLKEQRKVEKDSQILESVDI